MNKLTLKIKSLLDKGWNIDKICEILDYGIEKMEEVDSFMAEFERDEEKNKFYSSECNIKN